MVRLLCNLVEARSRQFDRGRNFEKMTMEFYTSYSFSVILSEYACPVKSL